MQTAHQQLSIFDTLPPRAPATMQAVTVKEHTRRVRAAQTLPYAKDSETSREAAERAVSGAETTRARVLACLRRHGAMTNDELGRRLNLTSGTICPRVKELRDSGDVACTGRRGKTASGASAWIWEAVK